MQYIIFDLEWNQARFCRLKVRQALEKLPFRLKGEIIQIGAVKLGTDGTFIDNFKVVVKPRYFAKLDKNITQLTGIDQEMLSMGVDFAEAIRLFRQWCGESPLLFSWGPDDLEILKQNCRLYETDDRWFDECFDLQKIFVGQIEDIKDRQVSLKKAVEYFSIEQSRNAHDALNDAYYAACIGRRLDLSASKREAARIKSDDIWDELTSELFSIVHNFTDKEEAFTKLKVARTYCPYCRRRLRNQRSVKARRNEYIFVNDCLEHGLFLVRIKFEKDYTARWLARKFVYPASRSFVEAHFPFHIADEVAAEAVRA